MTTYSGGCHCGKVRFDVSMELGKVTACNCSMCSKKGSLLAFVPATQFKLLSGDGDLSNYQFNKKVIDHLFCKHCGVTSFARGKRPDGTPVAAINVRCLDGIDAATLTVQHFDGRSL